MREFERAHKSWKIDNDQVKEHEPKKTEVKPMVSLKPTPTLIPCTFSENGFCRTQKELGNPTQCGIKRDSYAHQVCYKIQRGI